ncbi:BZ3500_MvSof-1268-A1-R1_Chr3-3g06467 [Microbotryum saponariae]|uniref:BZ3500_MvSof-1268-A1-R1_Chr3-3g06467 protein n=1 Tax=Microbotryum saponariae TaxID=289078 RepID=A0A2X0LBV4_9BASI|nr:BZ3500_MvSof-1268-A1-R1_Chr3-3g06467 [Microbotryum saponariae]SDA04434.1 BZ3501_MvSof-1269-A2-R1_Chr3-2g06154 [Microbotryum saponariae]
MFLQHLSVTLLVLATLLLLLVSLSTPISHKIYFLKADMAVSVATQTMKAKTLYLGNWGWCRGDVCSKPALGYRIDALSSVNGIGEIETLVRRFTSGLLLNPLACCLSFVAALLTLSPNLAVGMVAVFASALALFVTALALTFDVAFFLTIRIRLNRASDNVHAQLSHATWLVAAAIGLQFAATVAIYWMRHVQTALKFRKIQQMV